tara:strand:+ start:8513 stop:8857 length:345 start_codon:yes stop_codon:yes gene_type:complete
MLKRKERVASQKAALKAILDGDTLGNGDIKVRYSGKGIIDIKSEEVLKENFYDYKKWFIIPEPKRAYAYFSGGAHTKPSGTEKIRQVVFYEEKLTAYAEQNRVRAPEYDIEIKE